jgi:hypothetical protein
LAHKLSSVWKEHEGRKTMSGNLKDRLGALSGLVAGDRAADEVHSFFKRHFKLPGNPFPPSGIADATEENPPLRPKVEKEILDFIESSYRDRQFHFMIVTGDYGTGKTHTLRFIEQVVNTYMNVGDQSARAAYVERPRLEANELNRTVLRRLGFDTVRKYIWFALREVLVQEILNDSNEFRGLRRSLTLPQTKPGGALRGNRRLWNEEDVPIPKTFNEVFSDESLDDYRTFLLTLERNGWNREAVRYYLVHCLVTAIGEDISLDLADSFIALLLARDEKSFSSWESLVSISKPKAGSSLQAPTFLQFLLRIMERNGIAYVYLLLDEFEEVPQGNLLSPRQRQEYLYTLREVFDKIPKGLAVVMAITPGALTALTEIATPLADRNWRTIHLQPIELEDAVKLVRFYFDRERKGSSIKGVKSGSIRPLDKTILGYILEHLPPNVQKTPRNLIQFLHRLFDYAAQNSIPKIDEELAEQVINDFAAMKPSQSQPPRKRK